MLSAAALVWRLRGPQPSRSGARAGERRTAVGELVLKCSARWRKLCAAMCRRQTALDEQFFAPRTAPAAELVCKTEFCNTRTLKQEIVRFLLERSAPTSLGPRGGARDRSANQLVCLFARNTHDNSALRSGRTAQIQAIHCRCAPNGRRSRYRSRWEAVRRARRDNRQVADSKAVLDCRQTRHQRETTTTWPRKPPPASS